MRAADEFACPRVHMMRGDVLFAFEYEPVQAFFHGLPGFCGLELEIVGVMEEDGMVVVVVTDEPFDGLLGVLPRVIHRIVVPCELSSVMNYREAEAVTVSCFVERMENIRRLSAYDSDAFSTGLYSPRSKGIFSEYLD